MIYFKKARRKKIMVCFFFLIVRTESKRRAKLRVLFCLGPASTSGQWRVHRRLEENKRNNKRKGFDFEIKNG